MPRWPALAVLLVAAGEAAVLTPLTVASTGTAIAIGAAVASGVTGGRAVIGAGVVGIEAQAAGLVLVRVQDSAVPVVALGVRRGECQAAVRAPLIGARRLDSTETGTWLVTVILAGHHVPPRAGTMTDQHQRQALAADDVSTARDLAATGSAATTDRPARE